MMSDVKEWEFQFADAAADMSRSSIKDTRSFDSGAVLKVLSSKIAMVNNSLLTIFSRNPGIDLVAEAKKVRVLTNLADFCIMVNLSVLGVDRAAKVIDVENALASIPIPGVPNLGTNRLNP